MKIIKQISAIAICIIMLIACKKDINPTADTGTTENSLNEDAGRYLNNSRHIYTQSNQTNGNKIMVYKKLNNGQLQYMASYPTGGNGTGGGLGNQGSVTISDNGQLLFAVNAGSNSVSLFRITSQGLQLACTAPSGGIRPVSVTQHGKFVYVLNAGGEGNISGFTIGHNQQLSAIANSIKPLSSPSAAAAQISFTRNGNVLVITEKASNKIISYTINSYGIPGIMHQITSANATPFGFATGRFGNIYVSEAAGGMPNASTVSSYKVRADGFITLTQGPVGTNQTAACWVVITKNNRYAYTTNTASNTISSFNIHSYSGNLNLQSDIATTTEAGPIDAAVSSDSKFLYVLTGASNTIQSFRIGQSGALSHIQTITGIAAGANGLAAE